SVCLFLCFSVLFCGLTGRALWDRLRLPLFPPSWLKPFLAPLPPEPNPFLLCRGQRRRKVLSSLQHPSTLSYRGVLKKNYFFLPRITPLGCRKNTILPLWGRQTLFQEQEAETLQWEARSLPDKGLRGNNPPPPPTPLFCPCEPPDPQTRRGISPITIGLSPLSDLYNWKAQNPKFSEKPAELIDLLDSVLFTHQPTWDDCQQLLQVLFTTEEKERILNGARKLVLGADGNPTTNQAQIDASFPLTRPQWDFNTAEGSRHGGCQQ
uniref:uncharacterized protein LOC132670166 n=1 Tax=Panthera onca TaxID=9690 RepID=UPI0029544858